MKTDRPGIGHNRPPRDKPRIRNGATYQGFTCGLGAWLFICACADAKGYDRPQRNPVPGVPGFVVERDALSKHDWQLLHFRTDWIMALTWFFATSGATVTLPNDFLGSGSTIYCIGAGGEGFFQSGGGGGACSYSAGTSYSANQVVNIQVGVGDTWFDTSTTIKGSAAVAYLGGDTATGFGTTKVKGGDAKVAVTYGGGGAGGISAGNNAPSSTGGQGDGAIGGAGGTTGNPGANGAEFQVSPARGAGGGGGQGILCPPTNGGNGGLYGGGGGGAVTTCCPCTCTSFGGLGAQGLIAGSYTPSSGLPLQPARLFHF